MELVARNLCKRYGPTPALAGVGLQAGPGVVALLGANGAGKTTLLRILATVMRPDAGEVAFAGMPYTGDLRPLRRLLGYQPQHLQFPGHLTPRRFLRYMAQLKGVQAEPQATGLLQQVGLEPLADTPLERLSGGQVRRLGLAQALLGSPRLLLLDEPTRGLDPEERERVLALVSRLARDRVVLLSSHLPGEVEKVADQVVVLQAGQVAFSGSVPDLLWTAAGRVYEVTVPASAVPAYLQRYVVSRVQEGREGVRLRVVGAPHPGTEAAGEALPGNSCGSRQAWKPVRPTLEDAYLALAGAAARLSGAERSARG